MALYEPGERVIFIEQGYPLTGKRGTVQPSHSNSYSISVTFDHGIGTETWPASYFGPIPDTPSSVPPKCEAV